MFGTTLNLHGKEYDETIFARRMAKEKPNGLTLCENGISLYGISVPCAGPELQEAAVFLQSVLRRMTGGEYPFRDTSPAIRITLDADAAVLLEDGYRVEVKGSDLLISAASPMGAAYGIYGFLEDTLGCMWITPAEDYVPHLPTIRLPSVNETHRPAMPWRSYYSHEAAENHWYRRLRLNGITWDEKEEKPDYAAGWGTWCHSYYTFVPPDVYFKEHPDYYSKQFGRRICHAPFSKREGQLCLSNPEVKRIVIENLRKRIEAEPEKNYWDFSVMDTWNVKGCHCKNCKKLDRAAGGGMGSLLPVINELARLFPQKTMSTLAYFHTIQPPKGIKAEPNVIIKLCAMPGSQASSYLQGGTKKSRDFQRFLEGWNAAADQILIWDYVINFKHLLLPFPNFTVQRENQAFYESHHVSGVFHQASRETGDEWAELRTYVLSRLLFEGSSMDVEAIVMKYLSVAYGKAAPYLRDYLELSSRYLYESQKDLGLYDQPRVHKKGYLSQTAIGEYLHLFSQAEAAAEGNESIASRVEKAKIPVLYAKMMESSRDREGKRRAAKEFFLLIDRYGIDQISEVNLSAEAFRKKYKYQ